MASWQDFAATDPILAAAGERMLLVNNPDAPVLAGLAYLATVRADGGPRIHPISPVLHAGRLYAFVIRKSPKCRDLHRDGRYALHSFPHPLEPDSFNDEEFYLAGTARLEPDPALRQAVATACGDAVESGDVFALDLEHVLHKTRPDGKLTYTHWAAG